MAYSQFSSGPDYYTWRQANVRTRYGVYTLFDKPGMAHFGQPDHAAALLADEMDVGPDDHALLINCGAGLPGLAAADAGAHVIMVDANIVAVAATRRAAAANGLADYVMVSPPGPQTLGGTLGQPGDANRSVHDAGATKPSEPSPASPKIGGGGAEPSQASQAKPLPRLGAGGLSQPSEPVPASSKIGGRRAELADIAAVLLPKGKAAALQSIWDAYQSLKPGGRFYIAGANAEGAKTYFRYVEDLFGPIAVRGYRKGCRVGEAVKPVEPLPLSRRFQEPWLDHAYFHSFNVTIGGHALDVRSRPGVFSWDRLDTGTEALLSVMQMDPDDNVLDLGCGAGIIGTVAAKQASQGEVLMLDANADAAVSARQTLAANNVTNASVEWSDCAAIVTDRLFDVVVTNPPFHQGKATQYDVAYQFIRDAARVLEPGGQFYLVANRFIPYEETIRQCLGHVDTIHEDRRFKVLMGRKS